MSGRTRTALLRPRRATARDAAVAAAAGFVRAGRLVVFPTETVYGLGASALDARAVRRIFRAKGRPADNPLIVHVATRTQARALMQRVPDGFDALVRVFWPGPLTLVVERNAAVPDVVTAGLATVAIRMPAHPLARALIRAAGTPIAAPSANLSGRPSPTDARDAWEELHGRVAAVLDGGPCAIGIESTVLDLTGGTPTILRPGATTRRAIERTLERRVRLAAGDSARPASPGMKYRHYAPRTPVTLVEGPVPSLAASLRSRVHALRRGGSRIALLGPARCATCGADAFYSTGRGTPAEYARALYRGLRVLDRAGVDRILCVAIAREGLGAAVMNRLDKASAAVIRLREARA